MQSNDPYQINVLLAYDSAQTRSAIVGMFDRISSHLRDKKIFNVNAFRFGLLERADRFHLMASSASAELVMVAFGDSGVPGAGLLSWLESWAEQHAGQDSALGFLPVGAIAGEPVRRMVRALGSIAARHGLRFICGGQGEDGLAGLALPA
ncbi:MAG TPA: hypothetical protein VGO59_01925 [Verrucomicrobiae bacterium]|jgi:hypothetical protein